MPNQVTQPGVRKNTLAFAVSFAATGVVSTYTVPAGKSATLTAYGVRLQAATTVVQTQHLQGASALALHVPAGGADYVQNDCGVQLAAGEAARQNVTTATVADTGDCALYYLEEL
jgi:hypothetical protein